MLVDCEVAELMAGTVPIRFGMDPWYTAFECCSVLCPEVPVCIFCVFRDLPSVANPFDCCFDLLTSGMWVVF